MSSNYRNTKQRMTLLHLQTRLDQEVCSICPFSSSPDNKNCEGCPTFKELNRIGDWFNKDSQQHKPLILHEKKQGKVLITREEYIEFKSKGIPDTEIAMNMGVSVPTLDKWKGKNKVRKIDLRGILV